MVQVFAPLVSLHLFLLVAIVIPASLLKSLISLYLSGFQVFFSRFSFLLLPFRTLRRILDIIRILKTDHYLLPYIISINNDILLSVS